MPQSIYDANRDPIGYQQITALGTAVSLTPPTGADVAIIQAEGQPVRWRDDGTDPTTTVGMRLAAGADFLYTGSLSDMRLIGEALGAILNVSYYE